MQSSRSSRGATRPAATVSTRRPRSKPEAPAAKPAAPRPTPPKARAAKDSRLGPDLTAIGLGLLGGLLTLALFRPGSTGMFGSFLVQFVRFWMGHVVWVAPLLFVGLGAVLALDYRRATNLQGILGLTGFLAAVFGWVHLMSTEHGHVFDSTGARFAALVGRHADPALIVRPDGGIFGAAVMSLTFPLGNWGAYLTLGAVAAGSLLVLGDLTIRGVLERVHERSRIAAERTCAAASRTHRGAVAMGERIRDAAAAMPRRNRQPLFLDVDTPALPEATPAPKAAPRSSGIAGLFRSKPAEVPDDSPELSAAATNRGATAAKREAATESAIVPISANAASPSLPLDDILVPDGTDRTDRADRTNGKPKAFRPVRREVPAAGSGEGYVLPPLSLLDSPTPRPKRAATEAEANISILENTLAQFRIQAQVVEIADGPTVTRYEIRLGEGIRVKKILDLADNIAMSLAAMSVRVEAPIPGKAAIGIEVPKKASCVVTLKECLESDEARDMKSMVGFVLGKDVAGNVRCANLAGMPHLLVAGATNSGKSVCLNVLIASMLFRARPDELKMIMIDPKRVELTLFDGIPHLIHPVVKDVKQAAGILRWVLKEMDRRYDLFGHVMTRNIEGYNDKADKDPSKRLERLPFLVVVIDELADLMMQQGPEVEQAICRIAQLARATGIHLVVATQRPSVDVITGLIKSNIPSRIAFSVSSQIDSRTILDGKGAENLIGRGDMLFKPVDAAKPIRIQGAFLREGEVEAMVAHLKAQGRPEYVAEALSVDHGAHGVASEEESEDELFEPAARFIVTTGHASTSMIQRKFKIGYTRAARLVDMMEQKGIVGALDGAKPREIMMSRDSLDQMFLTIRNSAGPFRHCGEDTGAQESTAPGEDEDGDDEIVELFLEDTHPQTNPFAE